MFFRRHTCIRSVDQYKQCLYFCHVLHCLSQFPRSSLKSFRVCKSLYDLLITFLGLTIVQIQHYSMPGLEKSNNTDITFDCPGVISTPDVKFIDISADRNPFMILVAWTRLEAKELCCFLWWTKGFALLNLSRLSWLQTTMHDQGEQGIDKFLLNLLRFVVEFVTFLSDRPTVLRINRLEIMWTPWGLNPRHQMEFGSSWHQCLWLEYRRKHESMKNKQVKWWHSVTIWWSV